MVLRLLIQLQLYLKAQYCRFLRQKVLISVLAAAAVYFTLHLTSSVITFRRTPRVAWVLEQQAGSCSPHTNIAFLKTHKCASSTIQNILFRYGLSHHLLFGLPDAGNYFGGGFYPFHADMFNLSPWSKLGVNIMAVHMKWDHQQVAKVMPNDTVYITIVREPTELFESLYAYAKMDQAYNMMVEDFVASVPVEAERHRGFLGYNQMVWDFGIANKTLVNNLTAVRQLVQEAEDNFQLVMVAERMEESLVLLSHILCWDLKDVVALKFNARTSRFKKKLSSETLKVLRQKLAPDYLLYEHFSSRFEELVEDFGKERMASEVSRLQALTKSLMDTCGFIKEDSVFLAGAEKPWSNMVEGYVASSGNTKCHQYSRSEISFINLLRGIQRAEVCKRFGVPDIPGLDALPLGSHLFENVNMEENIRLLKTLLVHVNNKVAHADSGVVQADSSVKGSVVDRTTTTISRETT
nr:galactose-3-O-sulfotransferase 2-like [Cherax quadricarinatus]